MIWKEVYFWSLYIFDVSLFVLFLYTEDLADLVIYVIPLARDY